MTFAAAVRVLPLTLILAACLDGPEKNAAAKSDLTCSSVRSEHEKAQAHLRQRVEEVRAADQAARKTGKPDVTLNPVFQELMADIERAEGRFAARSKDCVGD